MAEQRGIEPLTSACERVSIGSTDYDTFTYFDRHSTKQPSEQAFTFHYFLHVPIHRPTVAST